MPKNETAPKDSGSPEQGKQSDNPKGKQDDDSQSNGENIKNLQKKLTEKDKMIKDLESKVNKSQDESEIAQLKETISKMNESLTQINREKRTQELKSKYPDIAPTLLVDLPDDKIEAVVKEQREVAKEHYKGAEVLQVPQYNSKSEVDKKIEEVQKAKMSGIQKATEVMKLTRLRDSLSD